MYELFLKMNSHALYQVEGKRLLPGESLWQTDMKRGRALRAGASWAELVLTACALNASESEASSPPVQARLSCSQETRKTEVDVNQTNACANTPLSKEHLSLKMF